MKHVVNVWLNMLFKVYIQGRTLRTFSREEKFERHWCGKNKYVFCHPLDLWSTGNDEEYVKCKSLHKNPIKSLPRGKKSKGIGVEKY